MDAGTQKDHLRLVWDGKTYRAEGYVLGKKIRKSLKIRSESKRKLAQEVLGVMFNEEYMNGLARQKARQSKLFSDAAFEYMEAKGYNRYADYAEKILQILGPHARIDELDEATLFSIGVKNLPTYSRQSVIDCFVKPARTMIRHAKGESMRKLPAKVSLKHILTVQQTLRLLDTAENHEDVLRWDPDRRTFQKIVFQLGGGASPGETSVVQASDVDVGLKRVLISGREAGGGKNPYRRRYVYLPDFYWERLGELPESGKVFLTPRGDPYAPRQFRGGQYTAALASVARIAGLPDGVTPHALRRTWATHFYLATLNMKALTLLGGWADSALPMERYVKLLPAGTKRELLKASINYGQVLGKLEFGGG